jgi:hypothetical protein
MLAIHMHMMMIEWVYDKIGSIIYLGEVLARAKIYWPIVYIIKHFIIIS